MVVLVFEYNVLLNENLIIENFYLKQYRRYASSVINNALTEVMLN